MNTHSTKFAVALLCLVLIKPYHSFSQSKPSTRQETKEEKNVNRKLERTQWKLERFKEFLNTDVRSDTSGFITPYMFDSLVINHQRALSGSQVEAGKTFGSSATISDKGATVNLGLGNIHNVYTQFHISGTGKESFISLFEDGKYGNTVSSGVNLNIFRKGSGFFSPSNKRIMRTKLEELFEEYKEPNEMFAKKIKAIRSHIKELQKIDPYVKSIRGQDTALAKALALTSAEAGQLTNFLNHVDTLISEGIITNDFLPEEFKDDNAVDELRTKIDNLAGKWNNDTSNVVKLFKNNLVLTKYESLQKTAEWNAMRHDWFSVSLDANVSPYNVLDRTAKDKKYVTVDHDYFFSGSLSYNLLFSQMRNKQIKLFISPTIKVQNAKQYNSDYLITLERYIPDPIGQDSLVRKDMTTTVYPDFAKRKWAVSIELPMIIYFSKSNFGFELTPRRSWNDINNDNLGVKFGVYIPVQVKEGTPLIIQPIFKLQKLQKWADNNEAIKPDFWKDNVVIGFNLSVSLPTGLDKIGNSKK